MSLTSLSAMIEYNKSEMEKCRKNSENIRKRIYEQTKGEDQIINHLSKCKWDLNFYKTHLDNLNLEALGENIEGQYFDYDFMEVVRCIINSFLVSAPDIHHWVTNLKSITHETSEGYVFFAKLREILDFLVIKVPRPKQSLIHELFVGLVGTNSLRQYIPNFAYLYSFYKCSPPFLRPNNNKVLTWCQDHPPQIEYLFYERIPTTISLFDYLENANFDMFLRVYLQALFALQVAGREIKFTHYDLHTDNILLRNPPHPDLVGRQFYIPFYKDGDVTEGKNVYILADQIVTFIDYGFSRIEYEGKIYSSGQITINDRIYFPLQDAYYLLLRSLETLISNYKRRDLNEQMLILLSFFYETTIKDLSPYLVNIYELLKVGYLPSKFSEIPLSQLLRFIEEKFPNEYREIVTHTPEKNIDILETNILPEQDIQQILGLRREPQFTDLSDFYNAYMSDQNKVYILDQENKEYFSEDQRKQELGEVDRKIFEVLNLGRDLAALPNIYSFNDLLFITLNNVDTDKYLKTLEFRTSLYNRLIEVNHQIRVLYSVAKIYNDKEMMNTLSAEYKSIANLIEDFNNVYNLIRSQYKQFIQEYESRSIKSIDIEVLKRIHDFLNACHLI